MDLLNISLHGRIFCFDGGGGGDMSFNLYENTNMGQCSDYALLFRDAHDLTSWPCA